LFIGKGGLLGRRKLYILSIKRHAMRPESYEAVTLCTHCWPMVLIMCRVLHIWDSQAVSTDRELSSVIQEEEENVLYLYY